METWRNGDMERWRHGHRDTDMESWTWRHEIKILGTSGILRQKIKWKTETRANFLMRIPFAHRTNGSLSFVHVLTKKQTEVIRLQTD